MTETNHIEVLQELEAYYTKNPSPEKLSALQAAITALSARASAGEGGVVGHELVSSLRAILAVAERRNSPEWNVVSDTARRALALTAAPQPAQTQGDDDNGSQDASVWTLIELAEKCGAKKDEDDSSTWWTLDVHAFYSLEEELRARNVDAGWPRPDTSQPAAAQGADELAVVTLREKIANAIRSTGHVTNSDKWEVADAVIATLAAASQPQYPAKFDRNGSETTDAADMLTPPAHGDGEGELPDLPTEAWNAVPGRLYTADQMREYARQALTTRPTPEARDAANAKRYLWLRDVANTAKMNDPIVVIGWYKPERRFIYGEELDAAIDAAIAALALPAQGEGKNG